MDTVSLLPSLVMFRFPVGHAYLWRDPSGLTLIDAGVPGSAPDLAAAIVSLGHRTADVRRVLLTHFHGDHIGSASSIVPWGDIQVYAHQADAPFIRGSAAGPAPVLTSDWERELHASVGASAGAAGPPPTARVDHEVTDGDEISLGGGVAAVCVAAPGHTPGSVSFHIPSAGVLLAGDTIARGFGGAVMLGVFNSDPPAAVSSFKRQAALAPAIACFGHGEPLTSGTAALLRDAADAL